MSTSEPVVSLDNVEVHFEESSSLFSFGSEPEPVRAVDGVSLDIHSGDVVVLVGESGCGKTTLGRTAIGVQRPTDGSVSYREQDIWDAKEGKGDVEIEFSEIRRSLQMVHQDPGSALNPNQKVIATLSAPLRKWHPNLSKEDRQARVFELLETVGVQPVEDYAFRYPHQLSGGEQQRVALIRSLLMNPDLVLGDEAVSALDVSLRVDMMELMLDLRERFETSFLFISHDLANARYLAEKAGGRIGIMYLGELVEIGPAEQIIKDPQHPYTKVLKWATPQLHSDDEGRMIETPVRSIDIPDPIDPPSGCRFHTRCPVAREACKKETPSMFDVTGEGQKAACFRQDSTHEYWHSRELDGTDRRVQEELDF
ncbi:ATP-binding cassette domain-containing protein [Haladaptatus sp. AB643]|nr:MULTISPECIES: oligopeptide/dipeptide ABC transporter ATP-binding protein [unclassified Haladaptatus]MCO8245276.1 ATP-binding cassette domain-containing protein [Haladaptatus sp. AB643]MCO8256606.1 ATP-binding cassette domain-containing protein [Haladaptatus sp. AB618]